MSDEKPSRPINTLLEQGEEWLSSRVEALQKTLAKAILGALTVAGPAILALSGLSTPSKVLSSVLWASVLANLWLLALVCWHRTAKRQLLAGQSKVPVLPDLSPQDLSVAAYLANKSLAVYADRIAEELKLSSLEVLRSLDKMEAHGMVVKTKNQNAGIDQFAASPKTREMCDP